jgi:hypothetical protein
VPVAFCVVVCEDVGCQCCIATGAESRSNPVIRAVSICPNSMSLLSVWLALVSSGASLEPDSGDSGKPQWGLGAMFYKRRCLKKVENVEYFPECMSVLDLPELALEGILGRLPPASLCQMAGVCQDLRKRCRSDYLWQSLFEEKWARIVGPSAFQEWQRQLILQAEQGAVVERPPRLWGWPISCLWPFTWLNLQGQPSAVPPPDSLMAWYWALEGGSFWFPAQVYNREVGTLSTASSPLCVTMVCQVQRFCCFVQSIVGLGCQ